MIARLRAEIACDKSKWVPAPAWILLGWASGFWLFATVPCSPWPA